jgi:Zn-finger nucleic acid-binding protein
VANPKLQKKPNSESVPEGQRPCPICGSPMRTAENRGVVIDVCDDHGVWLDRGELENLVARSKEKSREIFRKHAHSAKRKGKLEYLFWGPLSLLVD